MPDLPCEPSPFPERNAGTAQGQKIDSRGDSVSAIAMFEAWQREFAETQAEIPTEALCSLALRYLDRSAYCELREVAAHLRLSPSAALAVLHHLEAHALAHFDSKRCLWRIGRRPA